MTMTKQAYEFGAQLALQHAGLLKEAGAAVLPTLGRFVGENPILAKALLGAGIGGVGGAVSDVGAGRGMVAGGAAGLGLGLGTRLGKRLYGQHAVSKLEEGAEKAWEKSKAKGGLSLNLPGFKEIRMVHGRHKAMQDLGMGTPRWRNNLNLAGAAAGIPLGVAAGGGALALTSPSKPKHFWE